jgi:hypothetical protein
MIKVNAIINRGNELCIRFNEGLGISVIDKILNYINYDSSLYFYFFWGYDEYDENILIYYENYPQLQLDKGIIQIKECDTLDAKFIYTILNEYQIALLYVNKYPNLNENFDFVKWRDSYENYDGYIILDMMTDYVIIEKASCLPDWDFSKLGLYT